MNELYSNELKLYFDSQQRRIEQVENELQKLTGRIAQLEESAKSLASPKYYKCEDCGLEDATVCRYTLGSTDSVMCNDCAFRRAAKTFGAPLNPAK